MFEQYLDDNIITQRFQQIWCRWCWGPVLYYETQLNYYVDYDGTHTHDDNRIVDCVNHEWAMNDNKNDVNNSRIGNNERNEQTIVGTGDAFDFSNDSTVHDK